MNARILTAATLAVAFTGVLPARAADPKLVALVMPDAVVVAGVNVDQAKATPFGQYVLNQIQSTQDQKLQELMTLAGFDPTKDVSELLVASNSVGKGSPGGLCLGTGTFDTAKITAAATNGGGTTETYNKVTIIEDAKQTHGVAFLGSTLVIAGDLASVKAAIDQQGSAASIPSTLAVQINHWSTTSDAWSISNVPLSSLQPPQTAPNVPGLSGQGPFQSIQSAAGGVKFGNSVVVTAQAVADNAPDAKTVADTLTLLARLAQLQAAKDPAIASLAQAVQIGAQGSNVNVSLSIPEDQFEQILKSGNKSAAPHRATRKM